MAKKSKFEKWFIEQHGKRPSSMEDCILEQDWLGKSLKEIVAKDLMVKTRQWDARHTSALYAWQAAKGED